MKYRYVIFILGLAACLLLLSLIVSCDRNIGPEDPVEDETAIADKPGDPAGDLMKEAGPDSVAGPASSTSARPNGQVAPPVPGRTESGLTPMTATAAQLEAVYREGSKYPHLLKLKHSGPEILFVANQLLALPETDAAHSRLADWMEDRDWIRIERITSSALLLEWQGHDAEQFVSVRDQLLEAFPEDMIIEPNGIMTAFSEPDDPLFPQQKHHLTIRSMEGWDFASEASDVVVAVLDTGVERTHEDLENVIFVNAAEIPGNGIDDDGNGYVDDIHGWDFYANDAIPEDNNGHGTHMSGLIGATANNGVGGAGVAWDVRILPVKFLDGDKLGTVVELIQALDYISTLDVDIVNASFGGYSYSEAVFRAFENLSSADVIIVAAAGNQSLNTDLIPVYPMDFDLPGIIGVGASNNTRVRSEFSNYGAASVDLFAPGNLLLSCAPDNTYERASGTSQATALVSGALALLKKQHQDLDNVALKELLLERLRYEPNLEGLCQTGSLLDLSMLLNPQDPAPPRITRQPGDAFPDLGGSLVLDVEFVSETRYTVQWFSLEGPVNGANAPQLVIENIESRHGSTYWAVIANAFGEVKSAEVKVEVVSLPPAVEQVTDSSSILPGFPLSLKVKASGSDPLSYQWYVNGSAIPGATRNVFLKETFQEGDAGTYFVEVSNPWGTERSVDIVITSSAVDTYSWSPAESMGGLTSSRMDFGFFLSEDRLSYDFVPLPSGERRLEGPFSIDGAYYCVMESSGNGSVSLRRTHDLRNWETVVGPEALSPGFETVVPFKDGLLVSYAAEFNFIQIPSGNIVSYANPLPSVDEYPFEFGGGADAVSFEPAVYHTSDGITWERVLDGDIRRWTWDVRSGLYVAYSLEWDSRWATSTDALNWNPLDAGGESYIPGYLQSGTSRIDLLTGKAFYFGYETISGDQSGMALMKDSDRIFNYHYQADWESPVMRVYSKSSMESKSGFRSFHGELYSTHNGLFHWPAQGEPYEVRYDGQSLRDYAGKIGNDPVFRFGSAFLVMRSDRSFELRTPPEFIRQQGGIYQYGDIFATNFGSGEVWTTRDLENWVHEVGFPGTVIYRYRDHQIGITHNENHEVEIWKKNFGEWKWENHGPSGFKSPYTIEVFSSGFAAHNDGKVYVSQDGLNWAETNDFVENLIRRDDEVFIERGNQYYKTTDGGMTWTPLAVDPRHITETDQFVVRTDGGVPLIATKSDVSFRSAPVLAVDEDPGLRVPAAREVFVSVPDRDRLQSISVYLDGQLSATLDPEEDRFAVEFPEPDMLTLHVEALYEDGWKTRSAEVEMVTGISLNPLASGWIGSSAPHGLGVTIKATENAVYVAERQYGNIFKTVNGIDWELLRSNFGGAQHIFIEPRPGLLAVSLATPNSSILGSILDEESGTWSDIPNNKRDVFTTYVMFPWQEKLHVLFADGDLYEISSTGVLSFIRNISFPEYLLEGTTAYNIPLSISAEGSLLMFKSGDIYFLTEDLVDLKRFIVPEGWRVSNGLKLLRTGDFAYAEILDADGNLSPIRYLEPPPLDWISEPFPGWFIGAVRDYTWIGNAYGQFFPLADQSIPAGLVWPMEDAVLTINAKGKYQTFSAFEFEAVHLRVEDVSPDTDGLAVCDLRFVNNGILIPTKDEKILISAILYSADDEDRSWSLGTTEVDFSRNIPARQESLEFSLAIPGELPLGEYFLQVEIDADNAFEETDESNNSIRSNAFIHDPNVSLVSETTRGGVIESDQWNASMPAGTNVSLRAQASEGFAFLEWTGGVHSKSSELVLPMNASERVQAHFIPGWLLEVFPEITWKGIHGWYSVPSWLSVSPGSENAAYVEDFGWLIHSGPHDAAVWNPELGWLMRVPGMEAYFMFSSPGWLLYENGDYVHLPLQQ